MSNEKPKPVCNTCGKNRPIVAHGDCRECYDKKRLSVTLKLNTDLGRRVIEFSDKKRYSVHASVVHLIKCGLKWTEKQEALKKEYEL